MISAATTSRATLATLMTAVLLALVPAAAHADQYVVDHCTDFTSGAPRVAFGTFTGQTADTCGTQGGALLHQQGTLGANQTVEMALSIPADRPNIAIERVQTRYSSPGTTPGGAAGGSFAFLSLFNGSDQLVNNDVSGQPASPVVDLVLPRSRALRWTVYCTTLQTCIFSNDFLLHVNSTRLYLNEGVAPTLSVTGGTLVAAGGKAGSQSLVFDAADIDSGVASVTVSLDSTVVGAIQFSCAFSDWSACPRQQLNQLLRVDTTKVPNGTHELLITVRDAANNPLTRSLGTIVVANGPGPAIPNGGAAATRQAKLAARFGTAGKSSRRLAFGTRPTVSGTLAGTGGQPIGGATVAVLARLRQAGAAATQIATVQTGADGRFTYKVPGGPSRTITFAYTAFSGDATPAATASVRTIVRAQLSASIAPRSVRAGRPITLSGRLRLLPRKGVDIKIQARQGRAWRTIDEVRTNSRGAFHWSYRFKPANAGRTFAFRARVSSPIYPFATASSKPALVRVR